MPSLAQQHKPPRKTNRSVFAVHLKIGNSASFDRAMRGYPKQVLRPAAARAINHAIAKGRTLLVREVAKKTGLPVGQVRRLLVRAYKASSLRLLGIQRLRSQGIPVDKLPHKQTSAGVVGGKGEGKKLYPSAFIVKGRGQRAGQVFRRKGQSRYPIKRVYAQGLSRANINMAALNFAILRFFLIEFHRQATLLQNTTYARGRL